MSDFRSHYGMSKTYSTNAAWTFATKAFGSGLIGSVLTSQRRSADHVLTICAGSRTDRCPSYGAAMKKIGNIGRQEVGRHKNNRAENSHLPFQATRTSHAPLSTDAKLAEVRRTVAERPRKPEERRPSQMARADRCLRPVDRRTSETGSHCTDNTIYCLTHAWLVIKYHLVSPTVGA